MDSTSTSITRKKRRPERLFRVWDGEGHDFPDGSHRLTLLAFKDEYGERDYIANPDGLTTKDCIVFLLAKRRAAYNVWFSFGYDVNKILEGLPLHGRRGSLEHLWKTGRTWWSRMFAKYIPRKFFSLRHDSERFTSADTFSFFQKSFLETCKEWGIDASAIEQGKAARGTFQTWSMEQIIEYNFAELDLFLRLVQALRKSLQAVDLIPQSWHGPGAIAARWLRRERIAEHFGSWPEPMQTPVLHAYFGGRIDAGLVGEVFAYKRDLASAYPAALCDCLSQTALEWHLTGPDALPGDLDRHGLYHVTWALPRSKKWYPFPWRSARGTVLFPPDGEGWYWGVEVKAALRLFPTGIRIVEAWLPEGPRSFPFAAPIARDYEMRSERKPHKRDKCKWNGVHDGFTCEEGHGSHFAIRLGLNSIYGKLAQHLAEGGKKPRWQNYVWAGYTTAWTRARILDAIAEVGDENMLAVMTDGIFTRVPVHAETPALGNWDDEGSATVLIVMPGLYAVYKEDGELKIAKQRGLPARINYGWVLRSWGCVTKRHVPCKRPGCKPDGCKLCNGSSTSHENFIGMGKALATDAPFGKFVSEERMIHNVTIGGTSKRLPHPAALMGLKRWKEFPLIPKARPEKVISYAYKWREEFDPKEDKET